MIVIHVDQDEIKKGNDAIVVRDGSDFPEWTREYGITCPDCNVFMGRVIQRDTQDEHGASVVVELVG